MKIIESLKSDDSKVEAFINDIKTEQEGTVLMELQLQIVKQELNDFLYKEDPTSKISTGTKMLFLQTFLLAHDLFKYTLHILSSTDMKLPEAFNYMNILGFRIKKAMGQYLDIDFMLNALKDYYGDSQATAYVRENLDKWWDVEDITKLRSLVG